MRQSDPRSPLTPLDPCLSVLNCHERTLAEHPIDNL